MVRRLRRVAESFLPSELFMAIWRFVCYAVVGEAAKSLRAA